MAWIFRIFKILMLLNQIPSKNAVQEFEKGGFPGETPV